MERLLKSLLSVLLFLTLPAMVQAQFNYVTNSGTITIFAAVNELIDDDARLGAGKSPGGGVRKPSCSKYPLDPMDVIIGASCGWCKG
jgi:hypothetical protein